MKGKKAQRQQSRLLENRAQQKRTIDRCYYGTIRAELHKQPPPFFIFLCIRAQLSHNCTSWKKATHERRVPFLLPWFTAVIQRAGNRLHVGFRKKQAQLSSLQFFGTSWVMRVEFFKLLQGTCFRREGLSHLLPCALPWDRNEAFNCPTPLGEKWWGRIWSVPSISSPISSPFPGGRKHVGHPAPKVSFVRASSTLTASPINREAEPRQVFPKTK